MLGNLDVEIRETRRRIEERKHLGNCLKEAVNDIRRYRRRLKELDKARRDLEGSDANPEERREVVIQAHVAEAVLEALMDTRDRLRNDMSAAVGIEADWSRLMSEREKRLAALPEPLQARLGEIEEQKGKLIGQIRVAQHVRLAAQTVSNATADLERLLAQEADLEDLVVSLITTQKAALDLRRQAKHMAPEANDREGDLQSLLGFADRFAASVVREHGRSAQPTMTLRRLGELEHAAMTMMERAGGFLDERRRDSAALDQAAPAPELYA